MSAEQKPRPPSLQPSLFDVPDVRMPDVQASDIEVADALDPDFREPDAPAPDVQEPGFEMPDAHGPGSERPGFEVSVLRSKRRRKSVGGQLLGDTLHVTVPSWMSKADEALAVADMVRRFSRRRSAERFDLPGRAARLARRHGLDRPTEIGWSDSMQRRWGSCTPATGSVRLSTRLASFPDWVVDYVVVHELAHLTVADHSPAFWALVERYPLAERARGYLIARSDDAETADDF